MKKILIFIIMAVTLAGCSTAKKAEAYLKEKCADSSIQKQADGSYKISVHCINLYATDKVKQYLPVGKVTYDVAEAELSIVGVSKDSIPDVLSIIKSISQGVKK